jgi:hypothetical protein
LASAYSAPLPQIKKKVFAPLFSKSGFFLLIPTVLVFDLSTVTVMAAHCAAIHA